MCPKKSLTVKTTTYNNHLFLLTQCCLEQTSLSQPVGENQLGTLHPSCSYLLSVKHRGEVRGQISSQEHGAFTC